MIKSKGSYPVTMPTLPDNVNFCIVGVSLFKISDSKGTARRESSVPTAEATTPVSPQDEMVRLLSVMIAGTSGALLERKSCFSAWRAVWECVAEKVRAPMTLEMDA